MIWTESTGDYSPNRTESPWFFWFEYPFIFWPYSMIWFALFVVEHWDLGPFTRVRFCFLILFLSLFVYGIICPPYVFFDGFGGP